jgi:hypothetical protein
MYCDAAMPPGVPGALPSKLSDDNSLILKLKSCSVISPEETTSEVSVSLEQPTVKENIKLRVSVVIRIFIIECLFRCKLLLTD